MDIDLAQQGSRDHSDFAVVHCRESDGIKEYHLPR